MELEVTYTKLLKRGYRLVTLKRKIRVSDSKPGEVFRVARELAVKYYGPEIDFYSSLNYPTLKYSVRLMDKWGKPRVATIYIKRS